MAKTTTPESITSTHYDFERPRRTASLSLPPLDLSEEPRGHLLHRSISDSLRTGVTDPALGVGMFSDYDGDDVSMVDASADFRSDRLVRIEQGIDSAFRSVAPSVSALTTASSEDTSASIPGTPSPAESSSTESAS